MTTTTTTTMKMMTTQQQQEQKSSSKELMLTIISRYSYPCLCHEGIQGNGGIAPLILNLYTRLSWGVGFMPWLFWMPRKSPWYPLCRRLGFSRASIFIL